MTQQINLLQARGTPRRAAAWTSASLGLAALLLIAYGWSASARTYHLRAEAAASEASLVQIQSSIAAAQRSAAGPDAQALSVELAQLRSRSEALRRRVEQASPEVIGGSVGYSRHFAALAAIARDDVWITGVSVGKNGKEVAITGRAMRNEDVIAYVKRLNAAYQALDVHFNSIEFQPEASNAAAGTAPAAGAPSLVSFKVS